MSLLSTSAPIALALFALTTTARADVTASITGVVEDALMHPLGKASVVLHGASGETVARTTTAPDGKFQFTAIPIGDYTVEASSPGRSSRSPRTGLCLRRRRRRAPSRP